MERLLLETVPFRDDSFNKNTSVCFTRFFFWRWKTDWNERENADDRSKSRWMADVKLHKTIKTSRHVFADFSLSSKNKKGLRR